MRLPPVSPCHPPWPRRPFRFLMALKCVFLPANPMWSIQLPWTGTSEGDFGCWNFSNTLKGPRGEKNLVTEFAYWKTPMRMDVRTRPPSLRMDSTLRPVCCWVTGAFTWGRLPIYFFWKTPMEMIDVIKPRLCWVDSVWRIATNCSMGLPGGRMAGFT